MHWHQPILLVALCACMDRHARVIFSLHHHHHPPQPFWLMLVHGEHAATGSAMRRTEDSQGPGGGGARDVQRATAPEDSTSGGAAGASVSGGRSAGCGSHGAATWAAGGSSPSAVSSLRGADGVDDTAVKYLLRAELKKKKEEEGEERKQELADEVLDDKLEAEFDALMAIGHRTSRQEARLSAVVRERLELVERREEEEDDEEEEEEEEAQDSKNFFLVRPCSSSTTAVVMCMTGFPGVALRAVFFPSVVKPRMLLLGRYVPEGQLSVAFCMAGFAGLCHLCAVFPFIVGRPCGTFSGQVVLARRCATTGAGPGPDSAQRCPWRLYRRSSWTSLLSREQVEYGS